MLLIVAAVNVVSEWFHIVVKWLRWLPNCTSEHTAAFWTLIVTVCAALLGVSALFYAWKTVEEAKKQARENAEYTKAPYWILLRGVLANYDDIHAKFRPDGAWHNSSVLSKDVEDVARTELYMGLLEYCDKLLEKKLLDERDFPASYRYRLKNIVTNGWIRTAKLGKEEDDGHRADWLAFINLCYRVGVPITGVEKLSDKEHSKLYPEGRINVAG